MTAEEKFIVIAKSVGISFWEGNGVSMYDDSQCEPLGRYYNVDIYDGKIYGLIHETTEDGYSYYVWDIDKLKGDDKWLEGVLHTAVYEDCYDDEITQLLKWYHDDSGKEDFPETIFGDCVYFHKSADVAVELEDD